MFRCICMLVVISSFAVCPLHSYAAHPFKTKHANAYGKGNIRFLLEGQIEQEGGHEKR